MLTTLSVDVDGLIDRTANLQVTMNNSNSNNNEEECD